MVTEPVGVGDAGPVFGLRNCLQYESFHDRLLSVFMLVSVKQTASARLLPVTHREEGWRKPREPVMKRYDFVDEQGELVVVSPRTIRPTTRSEPS